MTTRIVDVLPAPGDHASRPAAASVPAGSLYSCTDHDLVYRSDGAAWATWATLGGSFSGDAADLTGGPAPTAVLGSGTADGTTFLRGDNTWATPAGGGTSLLLATVRVASIVNGTLATAFQNGSSVDGITLATGDRILLASQTTGSANGIYTVNASGAPTRATDADTTGELVTGNTVYVSSGDVNASSYFALTNTGTITIGTTAQVWRRAAGEFRYPTSGSTVMGGQAGPLGGVSGGNGVAVGMGAAGGNRTSVGANFWTALGYRALYNVNGNSNTGIGSEALSLLTTGSDCSAVGRYAGNATSGGSTTDATTTETKNTLMGAYALAGAGASRASALGANANAKFSDTTVLGESTVGTQVFQTHTGPRALALKKMATPHTTSGNANDGELMLVDDGSGNLVYKVILDTKVITLAHELGTTHLTPFTTAGRPSAATTGAGAVYYDTTLSKPGFSDGTVWRDAAGTAI